MSAMKIIVLLIGTIALLATTGCIMSGGHGNGRGHEEHSTGVDHGEHPGDLDHGETQQR